MQFFQNHSTLLTGGAGQLGLVLTKEPIISDSSLSVILQILVAVVTILKLVIDYIRNEQKKRENGNTSNGNSQDNENGAQ
jgi:uncharacterized protein YqgC (DUF456 family)